MFSFLLTTQFVFVCIVFCTEKASLELSHNEAIRWNQKPAAWHFPTAVDSRAVVVGIPVAVEGILGAAVDSRLVAVKTLLMRDDVNLVAEDDN